MHFPPRLRFCGLPCKLKFSAAPAALLSPAGCMTSKSSGCAVGSAGKFEVEGLPGRHDCVALASGCTFVSLDSGSLHALPAAPMPAVPSCTPARLDGLPLCTPGECVGRGRELPASHALPTWYHRRTAPCCPNPRSVPTRTALLTHEELSPVFVCPIGREGQAAGPAALPLQRHRLPRLSQCEGGGLGSGSRGEGSTGG